MTPILAASSSIFSKAVLTSLVAGGIARRAAADVHRARRDDLRARRRAQPRPRGDDAARRLPRLPRRLLRPLGLARVPARRARRDDRRVADGRRCACGSASTRSSSASRSRSPARGSPACCRAPSSASSYPRLGAALDGRDPAARQDPGARPEPLHQPLLVYLGFAFAGLLVWVFRSTNIGLNLRAAGEKPEALDAAGISVRRDAQLGGARDRARWPASAGPTCRSSAPACSRRS